MGKYLVRCYYTYEGIVEVEADNENDAYDKGWELCEQMGTDELQYVGFQSAEVQDETGFITEFDD